MNTLVAVFCVLVSSELAFHIPIIHSIKAVNIIFNKVKKVLLSSLISDHWKEKVLPNYALQMFKYSLLIPVLIITLLAPIVTIMTLWFESITLAIEYLSTIQTIITMTISSIFYVRLRVKVINVRLH